MHFSIMMSTNIEAVFIPANVKPYSYGVMNYIKLSNILKYLKVGWIVYTELHLVSCD